MQWRIVLINVKLIPLRDDIEMLSLLLALCVGNPLVTGGFPSQRASDAGFHDFFDISLNKLLNKQLSCQCF